MKYDFFINKIVTKINFLPESGISLDFGEHEHFECFTKYSFSKNENDLKQIIGKRINNLLYEQDKFIAFYFDDLSLSFSLIPYDWRNPEDVVYKNYSDPTKIIIEIIN